MKHDPFPAFEHLMISQLASLFDESPVVCGRSLKRLGLRGRDGEPTPMAFELGLVEQVDLGDGSRPIWVWKKEQTVRMLESAGHKRETPSGLVAPDTPPDATATRLIGPFEARQFDPDGDGYEIADANGIVAIWCRGEWLAGTLVKLLNLCHRFKKWF